MQPDMGALKRIFEEALARRVKQYGTDDTRSAQAARDLGLFLKRFGEASEARSALAQDGGFMLVFMSGPGQWESCFLRRSTRRMIIGVKISCIASSIFPPGTTSVLARDMNESCSMLSR